MKRMKIKFGDHTPYTECMEQQLFVQILGD